MSRKSESYYQFKKIQAANDTNTNHLAHLLAGKAFAEMGDCYSYEGNLPWKILRDCTQEIQNAIDRDDFRPEWLQLYGLMDKALEYWSANNLARCCEAFFLLGQHCGELSMPSTQSYIEGLRAKQSNLARELPLVLKNINAEFTRKVVQGLAELQWKADVSESIRLAEMCEIIWALLPDCNLDEDMRNALPDRATGLRAWLRPIAPDYARRPGAPKKK